MTVRLRRLCGVAVVVGLAALLAAAAPRGVAENLPSPAGGLLAPAAADGSALVVVSSPDSLTVGDSAVVQRLESLGLSVSLADDRSVQPSDADGAELVYVAASVKHWFAAVRELGTVDVPLWTTDPRLFDDYGLTGPDQGTDYGYRPRSDIQIEAPDHPVAAGHTGTVTLQGPDARLGWGVPTASATTIATIASQPRHAAAFTVAAGDPLASGAPAPACRLSFPATEQGVQTFTPAAWQMFDAAVAWMADACPPPVPVDPPGEGVEHVVVVSVDGLNPDALTLLGRAGSPTFHRLIDEGASTLNARSAVELTRTLPNHTSMVTGRRIAVPGGHGVTFNKDDGSTVHDNAGEYVSSAFAVVHDAGGTTTFYAAKGKFDLLDRSWDSTNGAADVTGADDGKDKIDEYVRHWDSSRLTDLLVTQLRTDPASLSFLHLGAPDQVGHREGFLTEDYLDAVATVDTLIGGLLDAIATRPDLAESTVVIVTSDHGGEGTSHTNPDVPAHYTVPMFVWGVGVAAGADLYTLNPDRSDPGTSQPPYDTTAPPIRSAAVANLVTALLELPTVPGSQINTDQSLDASAQ